ncbi:phospho-N-acetylmuramoyl-pentapeptide-transferase [Acididesulfobacillus acetoxydans]|uniref:Glycosyl transferase 4 protein n=1 Tax=Acididesulfobacillus acetoxydans TaxID=1561005 RepID=A0A8S0W919_9FIRM|nr:MraY family glycosyltransferase [Acididesulfobacillus acetoxydans]CAA7602279.1 phospho-N-acetylmuramoyl-pentapeptide-transferase [Acididesulfobacillus acetoxydans]CEJ07503.1 Glycosyl transferase 4 protein [Acididesulfobacillus acetoxydans]
MSYWLTFALALFLAVVATPLSILLAKRWGAIDYPGARRVHKHPIPRLGGVAIYVAFWLTAAVTQKWDQTLSGLFLGSSLILAVGIWDDVRGMRPLVKLIWQIAAAAILLFFGFSMDQISLPLVRSLSLGGLGLVLVVFWVVGLVNTVNISDGLDGLAAGICFEAALLLFWSASRIHQVPAAHWTLALAGAALGFLFFNFHPARVFMGDSGSMFMGYMIGGISIAGLLKTATILGLVFPLLVLGMPLADLTFAIVRRKLRGSPIASADRGHLHHRLLDAGLTQRQAVLLMYGISACFGLTAVLGATGYWVWAAALLVADFALLLVILFRRTAVLLAFSRRHSK